jgi:hypothetical protein
MSDLFPGPPPMPQQARQAAQKREEMELRNRERRAAHGAACDRIRKLERIAEQIAGKLARFPDDAPDADEFAHLFHSVQDSIHRAEAEELAVRP